MSQMASTNGPHEPIDPRKGIAKATMPRIIPIAPMILDKLFKLKMRSLILWF